MQRKPTPMPSVLDPNNVATLPPEPLSEEAAEIFAKLYFAPTVTMNAVALEALLKECKE